MKVSSLVPETDKLRLASMEVAPIRTVMAANPLLYSHETSNGSSGSSSGYSSSSSSKNSPSF